MMSRWRFDMRTQSGGYVFENQHEEKNERHPSQQKRIRGNERRTIGRVEEDRTS